MGIKLQSGDSASNFVNVNSFNQLQTVTPKDSYGGLSAGFVQISAEVDSGSILRTRNVTAFEASDDYRLRVGVDQTLFNATFEGASILTTSWSNSSTNFITAMAQTGFVTLNSSSLNTDAAATNFRTWRHFPTFGTYPTYCEMWIREGGYDALNALSEWGYLYIFAQATRQVLDGVYFRRTSGGGLKGIITNNNLDIFEIDIDTRTVPSRDGYGVYDPAETNHYLISFHNDIARFWINDVVVGEIACPPQFATATGSSNQPIGFRIANFGTSSQPRVLNIGYVNVGYGDQNVNKPWSHAMSGMGGGAYQVQQGNIAGPTVTRTAATTGHPASATARATTAWSATTNPGTVNLGGLWTSSLLSSISSDVDYPLFSYLNPPAGSNTVAKTLYVTGVRIGDTNIVAAPGSTGAFFSYIVQVENSAVATSTADSATTTSGKATVIGGQGFAPSEAAGTFKPGFDMTFNPPLVVSPNKYFTVVARPFGTFTGGTLTVTGSVAVNGYWE